MRVLILGGDGYLGWPTAMFLAEQGHQVMVVDNYLRRKLDIELGIQSLTPAPRLETRVDYFNLHRASELAFNIEVVIGDCTHYGFLTGVFEAFKPESLIHYAELPSAPYSMQGVEEARLTLTNNLNATFNVIWAVIKHAPDCHIIKLGTLGEYGTPNIDIEEGWIDIKHNGREDRFLYPRQGSSLYHTSKVHDTDLLWFYVRTHGLRVTDLMQGPVYGLCTDESGLDAKLLPNFYYDALFGTVFNRFLVQAIAGIPLTIYGAGTQVRGYINVRDTLQCVGLAMTTLPDVGEMRILNQFTELFSVKELAVRIQQVGQQMGLDVSTQHIENPRHESEDHYYNPKHSGLFELGLNPHYLTDDRIQSMLETLMVYQSDIDTGLIMPDIKWGQA